MTKKRNIARSNVPSIRVIIIKYLETKDHPVPPREIAKEFDINESSVRARLNELLKEGKIYRPYRGYYQINPIHSMGDEVLPRVHNLVLSLDPCFFEEKIVDYDESFFGTRLRILYGFKRQRVTWFISNSDGLDLDGLRLALEVLRLQYLSTTGTNVCLDSLTVSTMELNQDYVSIRWDREGCITLRSFLGSFERIYQKRDFLRSEVKVHPQSLQDIYSLLKGGVMSYNVVKTQMMIIQGQENIMKQNEIIIDSLASILRYQRALIEKNYD